MVTLPFENRDTAARHLAQVLAPLRGAHPVILAIPRGAVPMAKRIADALDGDLDVVLVRKLGAPGNPELAIGAVDENGTILLNQPGSRELIGEAYLAREVQQQMALIEQRRQRYRHGRPGVALKGRTVIVVDDGLATGATMKAALRAARVQEPARLICAVPVAARDSLEDVKALADDVVCLATPVPFYGVGQFYHDFSEVTDVEVVRALHGVAEPEPCTNIHCPVRIPVGSLSLEGEVACPLEARGLVVFAHGSGSSRHSPRNRAVAQTLNVRGFATLLFDLLTAGEDEEASRRFDIDLLAQRLASTVRWLSATSAYRHLPLGLFGASTGAAAALLVAAQPDNPVVAVVARGGRVDLAGRECLSHIHCPVLLIVGETDREVLSLNRQAEAMMRPWAVIATIAGAGHLFEETGAMNQVAALASDWFERAFAGGNEFVDSEIS